jgi:hypothetical protein
VGVSRIPEAAGRRRAHLKAKGAPVLKGGSRLNDGCSRIPEETGRRRTCNRVGAPVLKGGSRLNDGCQPHPEGGGPEACAPKGNRVRGHLSSRVGLD